MTIEDRLDYAVGSIRFKDDVIENLRSQIKILEAKQNQELYVYDGHKISEK
jgi:hypothetical protein